MKVKTLIYWATTLLFALFMTFGGVMDFIKPEEMVKGVEHLGYPIFLCDILGFWKLAGVIALLMPGWPILKEWAYAGYFFNLTGAAASHAFVHDPQMNIFTPLIALAFAMISWQTRPASRRAWKCHSECGVSPGNGAEK